MMRFAGKLGCRCFAGAVLGALALAVFISTVFISTVFISTVARGEDPAFVFVSKDLSAAGAPDGDASPAARSRWSELMLRQADGELVRLLANDSHSASIPVDFADPDVSYDGRRIIFAGYSERERGWRIYEIGIDGRGFRQVTRSDRRTDLSRYGSAAPFLSAYDDLDPCYLPGGRICFVSTRYPGLAPDGRARTTNLYIVNVDGSDLHRITTERFGADTPAVEPSTGRIVYSRWWRSVPMVSPPADPEAEAEMPSEPPPPVPPGGYYNDGPPPPPPPPPPDPNAPPAVSGVSDSVFTGLNSWFLAGINPDGTGLSMYAGFHFDRELTQAWRPSFLPDGSVLALFLPETPFFGRPGPKGLRRFTQGIGRPGALGGPQSFRSTRPSEFIYASAAALPDGRVLVTAAPGSDPTRFDVFLQEGGARPQYLHGYETAAELDAVPVVVREAPPVIEERAAGRLVDEAPLSVAEAYERGGTFTFLVENIHANAPVNVALPNAPPFGKDLLIEFYMSPQRTSGDRFDAPILISRQRIPASGRVEAELPAGVPLFEVLRTTDGELAVGRDGQVYHVGGMNFGRAGQTARCVGCHTGHSMMAVPEDAAWTNLAPSAEIHTSPIRESQNGAFRPENLVDRRIVPASGDWEVANGDTSAQVQLVWGTTIRGRELVIYAPAPHRDNTQVINGLEVELWANRGGAVSRLAVSDVIQPAGTHVALDENLDFDMLRIIIAPRNVSGLYFGQAGAALSELEVIARGSGDVLAGFFTRGDADCNRRINVTDGLVTLQGLFYGEEGLCCEAAADADGSDAVDISDAIFLLNYLMLDGPTPPAPFPECASTHSSLVCNQDSCE